MIEEKDLRSLEKLHTMHESGILSDEEFKAAKQRILAGEPRQTEARQVGQGRYDTPEVNDHLGWMLFPLKRYAEFDGRSSRREFWMFLLLLNLATLAIAVSGLVVGLEIAFALWALGMLGILAPYLAVQARRFRDQRRSPWLVLLNLIPYVGAFIVLGFMLVDGTHGANEHGPDPVTT